MIECVHAHVCLRTHEYAFIHYHEYPMVGGKKRALSWPTNTFCIVDFSAMGLLFNLSAFDSKPLEAIISDE